VIGRVGSIVESPAMYPRFSGARNLELLGRISGVGRTRVREVLEEVGSPNARTIRSRRTRSA
jgi:ABC-2 type transport system ATP-binding protein